MSLLNDLDIQEINDELLSLNSISLEDIKFGGNNELVFDTIHKIPNDLIKTTRKEYKKSKISNDMFEWVKIDDKWKRKILSDNFYIYNCIDNENHNVETVIHNAKLCKITMIKSKLKKYLKDIPFDDFSNIIHSYKFYQNNNEFVGNFDSNGIKTRNALIKEITNENFELQSDMTTLQIIRKLFNVDFIMFDDKTKEIIHILEEEKLNDNVILIYRTKYKNSTSSNNYEKYIIKLIGIKVNDKIEYKFERNKIPKELNNILDRHTFLLLHAKNTINEFHKNKKKITIRNVMKDIINNSQTNITNNEIDELMIILKNLIEQHIFKKSIK